MGNFTKTIKETYEFDGDKIIVHMKRLTRVNANIISPHVELTATRVRQVKNQMGDDFNEEAAMSKALTPAEMSEYLDAAAKVLGDSVTLISGLYIEGEEVKVGSSEFEIVLNSVYFIELIMMMIADLMNNSYMEKEEEKKSEGQPEDTSNQS